MSSLSGDDRTAQQESTQQKQKGPEAFLTGEERKDLQRSLSFPEDLPPKFKNWIQEYLAVNIPQIPISNIVGFQVFKDQLAAQDAAITAAAVTVALDKVATSQTTTSTSYTDLATTGPTLEVNPGTYVFLIGANMQSHAVGFPARTAYMTLDIEGVGQGDGDAATVSNDSLVSGITVNTENITVQSTVTAKYRVSGGDGATFASRFLLALRIGNAT